MRVSLPAGDYPLTVKASATSRGFFVGLDDIVSTEGACPTSKQREGERGGKRKRESERGKKER